MPSNQLQRLLLRTVLARRYSVLSTEKLNLWTSDKTVISPHKEITIPKLLVTEKVFENLEKWSDKTAVVCGITNHSYTYHQLYKYSMNLGAKLRRKLKIMDGDVVTLMLPNSPEYCIAVLGILQAGAVVSTINPKYTSYEVTKHLDTAEPKLILGTYETIPIIRDALTRAKKDVPVVNVKSKIEQNVHSNAILFNELFENDEDYSILKEVRNMIDDVALLPFSSGTTGLPKGVELTHKNIVANCCQKNVDTVKTNRHTTANYQDTASALLPFYHIYGLVVIMLTYFAEGVKIVTLPNFQPQSYIRSLTDHKVNIICCVPPMVSFLGSHSDIKKEHLKHAHTLTCGAAPLPKPDIDVFLTKVMPNFKFIQIYGATETSPLVTTSLPESTDYTSAGHALSNTQLKIVNEKNLSMGPNMDGELWIKGPQVMKGYKNNPEATKNTITDDGWYRSGDMASISNDGALYIRDRLKELIKVKGYQVPPAELENVIKDHPSVKDVAVVGIRDEKTGEAPKAFIVLKTKHSTSSNDINAFVNERVAKFKRLKEVKFVDEIPRNPSGKILRKLLRDL